MGPTLTVLSEIRLALALTPNTSITVSYGGEDVVDEATTFDDLGAEEDSTFIVAVSGMGWFAEFMTIWRKVTRPRNLTSSDLLLASWTAC